jgi:UTP--glucose-1-phosphate uridylyltransferase
MAVTPPTLTALASPPVSAATDKMRQEGLPEIAIDTFAHYEERLRSGELGLLPEAELEPLTDVPSSEELPRTDASALSRVVVLKLNGGLGTSMGMTRAKSLLEIK